MWHVRAARHSAAGEVVFPVWRAGRFRSAATSPWAFPDRPTLAAGQIPSLRQFALPARAREQFLKFEPENE